jgi:hypothetical protein
MWNFTVRILNKFMMAIQYWIILYNPYFLGGKQKEISTSSVAAGADFAQAGATCSGLPLFSVAAEVISHLLA